MKGLLVISALAAVSAADLASGCIKQWCPVTQGPDLALATPEPAQRVPVFVQLPYLRQDRLDRIFHEVTDPKSPKYGEYLTHKELYDVIGNPNATTAVLAWLRAAGLEAGVSKSGYAVRAMGPVAAVERALGVRYQIFEHKSRKDGRTGEPLRVLRSATSPTVPPSMAPHVAFVAHVADFYENKIKPHFTPRAGAGGNASSPVKGPDSAYGNVRPATVWGQYDTPCTPDCPTDINGWQKASSGGHTNSHGLYEDGNYASQSDLKTFFADYMCSGSAAGNDACSSGKTNYPSLLAVVGQNDQSQCTPYAGSCGEATLDVQYISAVAPGMSALDGYWYSGESYAGFASSFVDFVDDLKDSGSPLVSSISYGLDEGELPVDTIQSACTGFQAIAATGRTVFVASGDAGASNYRGGSVDSDSPYCGYNPSFPAACPYITSVGATSFSPSSTASSYSNNIVYGKGFTGATSGGNEIPSSGGNQYGNQVTTGGGFSCVFSALSGKPYTSMENLVSGYTSTSNYFVPSSVQPSSSCTYSGVTSTTFNPKGRGFPDVVALGWQYELILGGTTFPGIAGTSAASPVMAGMFTIINGKRLLAGKPPVGFINTALYNAADSSDTIFNRIGPNPGEETSNRCVTSGSGCCSYGFTSTSGAKWDAFRGLGTVNFPALAEYFMTNSNFASF